MSRGRLSVAVLSPGFRCFTDSHGHGLGPQLSGLAKEKLGQGLGCCGSQNVVEVSMVERFVDKILEGSQFTVIDNESELVELIGLQYQFDLVVVPVQSSALMSRGETFDDVASAKAKPFGYLVHGPDVPRARSVPLWEIKGRNKS